MGRYLNFNGNEINSKSLSGYIIDIIEIINKQYKKETNKEFLVIEKSELLDSIVYRINNPDILIKQSNNLISDEKNVHSLVNELYDLNFEWHEYNGNKEEYEKYWKESLYKDIKYISNLFNEHGGSNRIKIYWNL